MAKKKKSDDSGFVGNLAERGEKAVNRLLEELANNPRVTEALGRAMSAKGKANSSARKTMAQFGVAAADELKDLRKQIERLERRLARMEEADRAQEDHDDEQGADRREGAFAGPRSFRRRWHRPWVHARRRLRSDLGLRAGHAQP